MAFRGLGNSRSIALAAAAATAAATTAAGPAGVTASAATTGTAAATGGHLTGSQLGHFTNQCSARALRGDRVHCSVSHRMVSFRRPAQCWPPRGDQRRLYAAAPPYFPARRKPNGGHAFQKLDEIHAKSRRIRGFSVSSPASSRGGRIPTEGVYHEWCRLFLGSGHDNRRMERNVRLLRSVISHSDSLQG